MRGQTRGKHREPDDDRSRLIGEALPTVTASRNRVKTQQHACGRLSRQRQPQARQSQNVGKAPLSPISAG